MIFNITTGAGSNEMNNLLNLGSSYINYTTRSIPAQCFVSRPAPSYSVTFLQCEYIGESAFKGNSYITNANFPTCQIIDEDAFYSCSSLSIISFPKCSMIGEKAFCSCKSLLSCDFPQCSTIGSSAFSGCTFLTSISFPNCVAINDYAFKNCKLSSQIVFPNCNFVYRYAFSGAFPSNGSWNVLKLPKITYIGSYALANTNLDEVWLGSEDYGGILIIEEYAFNFLLTTRASGPFAIYLPGLSLAQLTGSLYSSVYVQNRSFSIYVPAELLSAYKSATNWAGVSAYIFSISST